MDPDTCGRPVRVRVGVRTRSGALEVEVQVPADGCRPGDLLPALRAIDDALVAEAGRAGAAAGRRVSCRAGCAACCRHLAPVTPVEAAALVRLVGTMPATRQRVVRSRFAAAVHALTEAGLRRQLAQAPRLARPALRELALRYFHLGIPCPFLAHEDCSIYPQRPLMCREYVVTSPSESCRTLRNVERISVPGRLFPRIARQGDEGPAWVPLVLALDWLTEHPDAGNPGRTGSGPALLAETLGANRNTRISDHPPVDGAVSVSPSRAGR